MIHFNSAVADNDDDTDVVYGKCVNVITMHEDDKCPFRMMTLCLRTPVVLEHCGTVMPTTLPFLHFAFISKWNAWMYVFYFVWPLFTSMHVMQMFNVDVVSFLHRTTFRFGKHICCMFASIHITHVVLMISSDVLFCVCECTCSQLVPFLPIFHALQLGIRCFFPLSAYIHVFDLKMAKMAH